MHVSIWVPHVSTLNHKKAIQESCKAHIPNRMGIQAEDPQQPRPTCPIYFLARSSDFNLQMFSIFQSIKVLQLLHKSPGHSSCSRHLSHPIPRLAASRGKVEPNLTRKLAHTRCLSDRGKHTASDWKRHWNYRFWSHRQSFGAKFTHSFGVPVPMFLTMGPSRSEEAIFRCYKYFSLEN